MEIASPPLAQPREVLFRVAEGQPTLGERLVQWARDHGCAAVVAKEAQSASAGGVVHGSLLGRGRDRLDL